MWNLGLWNLNENIFLKILKPCLGLLKNKFKINLKTKAGFINSFEI
jgi:hypothetical protein